MTDKKQITSGIIGALIGAVLLYFVSYLYLAFNNSLNAYSIAFIVLGAVSGFFIGYGPKKKKEQKFFTFSPAKIGLAVLLAVLTLFGAFMFMDVTPDSGLIYYISIAYGWIFFFGIQIQTFIVGLLSRFIDTSSLVLGQVLSILSLIVHLLWSYFLVCLIFYIVRKFKK